MSVLIKGGRIAYDFRRDGWTDYEKWLAPAYCACLARSAR